MVSMEGELGMDKGAGPRGGCLGKAWIDPCGGGGGEGNGSD